MGGSAQTYSNTPAATNQFQNMLYNSVLNLKKPDTSTPNFANGTNYTPTTLGRRMAGGIAYTPFSGRSPLDASGRPVNDGLGYPIDYGSVPGTGYKPGNFPGSAVGPTASSYGESAVLGGRAMNARAVPRPTGGGVTTLPDGTLIPDYGGYRRGPNDPLSTNPDGSARTAQPRGSGPGGIQGIADFLSQIFSGMPNSPPGVGIGDLPGYDTAMAGSARMDAPTIGTLTRRPGESDEAFNIRSGSFNAEQSQFRNILAMIQSSAGADAGGAGTTVLPGSGGPIKAPTFSSEGTQTQSADQIARDSMGGDSMFTKNILPAYNDLFNTQNALTAATAKESAGNLTGSGFANTLGTALNRNTSSQQALLADVLNKLVSQEIGRQGAGADRAAGRNIAQGQGELAAATTSAQLAQQAQQLATQARSSGRQDLMAAAMELSNRAKTQAAMEQQGALTNAGFEQQTGLFNAGEENAANSQYFNAGVNRNQKQAELDAQRQNLIYGTSAGVNQQNSQQMMQLLQMLFGQINPTTTQTSGGIGGMLPGIAQLLALFL